ncbi:MAG: hypothetical protein ACRDGD_00495 [Candidatus Limnocylindria bacterium]
MTRRPRPILLATVTALLAVALAAPAAAAKGFNVSFEFEPVAFSDRTTGHLYVASKDKGKKTTNTTCTYLSETSEFLGQFQSTTFTDPDPEDLRQFCLDHYVDRS